jgi:predicted nucleic acid-binding protein
MRLNLLLPDMLDQSEFDTKKYIAAKLYEGGRLSTGQAAEVAAEYAEPLPAWIQIVPVTDVDNIKMACQFLHLGEFTAIALAMETEASLLVINESRGRSIARKLGLDITRTLGILITAYHAGLFSDAKTVLDYLRRCTFRIPPNAEELFR